VVAFEPDGGGTRVTVEHASAEHAPDGGAEQGWSDVLERLAALARSTGQSTSSRS
jgi:hypothetical protein